MIYFVQEGSSVIGKGRIKIGMSVNPLARLTSLQSGNPDPLYIVGIDGLDMGERFWHERFAEYRIGRTEWFWPGERLVEAVKNGYIDSLMYRQGADDWDEIDEEDVRVEDGWARECIESWGTAS